MNAEQPPQQPPQEHQAKKPTRYQTVREWFETRGLQGATDEETAEALELPGNTIRPRRREMVQLGLLVQAGEKRPTRMGGRATVWRIRLPGEETQYSSLHNPKLKLCPRCGRGFIRRSAAEDLEPGGSWAWVNDDMGRPTSALHNGSANTMNRVELHVIGDELALHIGLMAAVVPLAVLGALERRWGVPFQAYRPSGQVPIEEAMRWFGDELLQKAPPPVEPEAPPLSRDAEQALRLAIAAFDVAGQELFLPTATRARINAAREAAKRVLGE